MSFLGGWSTGSTAPALTSSGGGGWSTAPSGGSTGSGWLGGSSISGSGWLSTTPTTITTSGGGWLTSPTPAPTPTYYGGYSYQVSSPYSYQLSSPGYPGAGLQFGPYGEGGPYTPLDFPIMRELLPGERLEDLQARSGLASKSVLPYLALGVIAALLLKK